MLAKISRGKLLRVLELNCKVSPLARPRFCYYSGNVYQPKENQQSLLSALKANSSIPIDSECIVDANIYFKKPLKTKLEYPISRNYGDEDNLRKGINDALVTKGILADDSIVLGGETFKQFGPENKVFIHIYDVAGKI